MREGGWIFISHSHRDIEKVRRIRNRLEEMGLEPLMFYLKCLSDENEIEELIKREIDERDWFIYADSASARDSNWVRTEREYIESLAGKNVFTINLDGDMDAQLTAIDHITRQLKVFIVSACRDKPLVDRIRKKLLERDMMVLYDDESLPGDLELTMSVEDKLRYVYNDGFVLFVITERVASSDFVRYEITRTMEMGGKIVPVYVGSATLPESVRSLLMDSVGVTISPCPTDEELDRVVSLIHGQVTYDTDFKNGVGYRSARRITLPSVARIDNMTFFECDNLEEVTIPDSVIYISADAFEDHPDILVKCHAGSYAEGYCKRNGIRYEIAEG